MFMVTMSETDPTVPPTPPTPSSPAPAAPPPVPPVASQPIDYATSTVAGAYAGPAPDANAKQWAMIAHLSSLVELLGVPPIVGPLVVWAIKKNEHPFIAHQGKEAINFSITVLIAIAVCIPLVCLGGIGFVLMIAIGVAAVVLAIIASIRANEGVAYRYPWTLRLVK